MAPGELSCWGFSGLCSPPILTHSIISGMMQRAPFTSGITIVQAASEAQKKRGATHSWTDSLPWLFQNKALLKAVEDDPAYLSGFRGEKICFWYEILKGSNVKGQQRYLYVFQLHVHSVYNVTDVISHFVSHFCFLLHAHQTHVYFHSHTHISH